MLEAFIEKRFYGGGTKLIEQANGLITEYAQQGFSLTLRQLYYQFVARGWLPNSLKSYKMLGRAISQGRLAGLVDWAAIEDNVRYLQGTNTWRDPKSIVAESAGRYKEDTWRDQPYQPEVWVEKDALAGVVAPACNALRVNFFACRGYTSQTAQYDAGKRFERYEADGKKVIVFHLGDHDPSGIDMTRDNAERLELFARYKVTVKRLALNMKQITQYNPPPNPTKDKDVRSAGYRKKFGTDCWELDALEPRVIDALIRTNVERLIEREKWERSLYQESVNRSRIEQLVREQGQFLSDHFSVS